MFLVRRHDGLGSCGNLAELQEEVGRLFGRTVGPATGTLEQWWPGVDIVEEKDKILVRADLPGLKQEKIEVSVADDLLTIKGERQRELETKEGRVHRVERSYGTFLRSFVLPSSVDGAKVTATYKNGVLDVTLPKREDVLPKQIKVDVN